MLLDGLIDEKKQGITIDIAYKFFSLENKQFVLIDSPGHIEYTKNMAHAASHANVAIVLVDVINGLTLQTKNHLKIVSMFPNIKYLIVCINKMDLINFKEDHFNVCKQSIIEFCEENNVKVDNFIPISALEGVNITTTSNLTPFYNGPNLIDSLKNIELKSSKNDKGGYLLVQNISFDKNRRVYLTRHIGRKISSDDSVINLSTGEASGIKNIYTNFKKTQFIKDRNCSVELNKEISVAEGDILAKESNLINTQAFKIMLIKSSNEELNLNKRYLFKFKTVSVKVLFLKSLKLLMNIFLNAL